MLRLLVLAALAMSSASAQTEPMQALPPFGIPMTGNSRPPQTSATRAYLYAITATGALVGLGYVVYTSGPYVDQSRYTDYGQEAGGVLIALGVMAGPAVGNLSLGAGDDVRRGVLVKSVGVIGGAVLLGVALGASVPCIFEPDCATGGLAAGALYGSLVATGLGLAAGATYDLATIPANARWAREARANGNRVRVSPTAGLRRGAPVLGLRARF